MKYGKLLTKMFSRSAKNNNGQVAIALVAGLAAGAVLSILFAPARGSDVRKNIANKARGLNNGLMDGFASLKSRVLGTQEQEVEAHEVPHFKHVVPKKRKSAIKELVQEAHAQQNTEKPLS